MFTCVHLWICVEAQGWYRGSYSMALLPLFCWGSVSFSNPELTNRASLPYQLAPGIPCPFFKARIGGGVAHLHEFWDMNSCLPRKLFNHGAIPSSEVSFSLEMPYCFQVVCQKLDKIGCPFLQITFNHSNSLPNKKLTQIFRLMSSSNQHKSVASQQPSAGPVKTSCA